MEIPSYDLRNRLRRLSHGHLIYIANELDYTVPDALDSEGLVDFLVERQEARGAQFWDTLRIAEERLAERHRVQDSTYLAPAVAVDFDPDSDDKLSQKELEAHLWGAANLLRGKIDSSDFKHYIFGLLFYKRLSDVCDEEDAEPSEPGERLIRVPSRMRWSNVCQATTRIGERLNKAFADLEQLDPRLEGLFQGVDFANRERFPDATLQLLLRHFERHTLSNSLVEPDMLGNAYEYLIGKFANDAGKKGGEFYTPKRVVRLLVECLQPVGGMSVYDPACGSGGMLLEAHQYIRRYEKEAGGLPLDYFGVLPELKLFGQEMNLSTWAICRMNLFLHDIHEAKIERGDTLRDPKHLVDERLRKFDRVLANPPFSLKGWGREQWARGDVFGRDRYGCPPAQNGDLAFVQHMLASLKDDGKLGVVLPMGFLYREGVDGTIRKGLVRDDLIDAIIGLPKNLFYGTGIAACVVFITLRKELKRRGKILLIDGSREYVAGKARNELVDENVDQLASAYHAFEDNPGFSRVVSLEEVEARDCKLNIRPFIPAPVERSPDGDVESMVRQIRILDARCAEGYSEYEDLLEQLQDPLQAESSDSGGHHG